MRISDWSSDVCSSDLAALPPRQVAQRIALVEQRSETGDRITVRDAVELGRTPWLSALHPFSADDNAVVLRALAAVDMKGFAARHWHTLSGGEQDRKSTRLNSSH